MELSAIEVNFETVIIGIFNEKAIILAIVKPILIPVNEPGPLTTITLVKKEISLLDSSKSLFIYFNVLSVILFSSFSL